jgi:hypothetical protein
VALKCKDCKNTELFVACHRIYSEHYVDGKGEELEGIESEAQGPHIDGGWIVEKDEAHKCGVCGSNNITDTKPRKKRKVA